MRNLLILKALLIKSTGSQLFGKSTYSPGINHAKHKAELLADPPVRAVLLWSLTVLASSVSLNLLTHMMFVSINFVRVGLRTTHLES